MKGEHSFFFSMVLCALVLLLVPVVWGQDSGEEYVTIFRDDFSDEPNLSEKDNWTREDYKRINSIWCGCSYNLKCERNGFYIVGHGDCLRRTNITRAVRDASQHSASHRARLTVKPECRTL